MRRDSVKDLNDEPGRTSHEADDPWRFPDEEQIQDVRFDIVRPVVG